MILYLASDLLWASKIKGTAEALGLTARPVRSVEMLEARLAELGPGSSDPVHSLVLDLESGPLAFELLHRLKRDPGSWEQGIRVVAFGPHVETDVLNWARGAGAGSVLTRGAFAARLPDLLTDLSRSATGPKAESSPRSREAGLP